MLEICFLILKILGIIVLCVLGLILLILLLVLFAPVRYCSEGYKSSEGTCVKGIFTYLNPIVRVIINYPDKVKIKVKILGFTVYPTEIKKKKNAVQANNNAKKSKECGSPEEDFEQKKERSRSNTLDTIKYYTSLFSENKELVLDVLETILRAIKTILPRKCNVRAVYGTGQADTTGYIYAVYCSLQGALPGEIYLEPIWTEAHLKGEYYLKGKIRMIHLLISFVKISANKEARLLIKKLRRV